MIQLRKNSLISCLRGEIDFPINEIGVIIHQPSFEEIAYIGEYCLFFFLQILDLTIDALYECGIEKNENTEKMSDFDVLLYFINNDADTKDCFISMLNLLFPFYNIVLKENHVSFTYREDSSITRSLNQQNYRFFKEVCQSIFPLGENKVGDLEKISTIGKFGEEIKNKLIQRQKKLKEQKSNKSTSNTEVDVFGKYCVILSVGLPIDYEVIKKRTIFTIQSMFTAYMDKREYENFVQLKLVGAKDVTNVKDWIGKIIGTKSKEEK